MFVHFTSNRKDKSGNKNTLQNEPEMFMTYNNGISTTAKSIIVDEDKSDDTFVVIKKLPIGRLLMVDRQPPQYTMHCKQV